MNTCSLHSSIVKCPAAKRYCRYTRLLGAVETCMRLDIAIRATEIKVGKTAEKCKIITKEVKK